MKAVRINAHSQRRQDLSKLGGLIFFRANLSPGSGLLSYYVMQSGGIYRYLKSLRAYIHLVFFTKNTQGEILSNLHDRATLIKQLLVRSVELIRVREISNMSRQSVNNSYFRYFLVSSQLITEQSSLFSDIKDSSKLAAEKHMVNEIEAAWFLWKQNAKSLHFPESLQDDIQSDLKSDLATMESINNTYKLIDLKLSSYRRMLSDSLADDMPSHILSFDTWVEQQQAKLAKWSGDSEWQNYQQIIHMKNTKKDFEKSKSVLEEKIRDTEQRNLR